MRVIFRRVAPILLAAFVAFGGLPGLSWIGGGQAHATAVPEWMPFGAEGFTTDEIDYSSMAIDPENGDVYVAFQDHSQNQKLSVMKNDGSGWAYVGEPGFSSGTAQFSSIIIVEGMPFVSYQDSGTYGFKATVMKFNGEWSTVGVPGISAGLVGYTRLLYHGGTVYLAYTDASSGLKAMVKKYEDNSWSPVGNGTGGTIISDGEATDLSFAGGPDGILYAAFKDNGREGKAVLMKYAGSPASWSVVGDKPISSGSVEFTSLAIDDAGVPYVAYRDADHEYKVTVMKFSNSGWEPVGNPGFSSGVVGSVSVAINGDTPYVAYSLAQGKAMLQKFNGNVWKVVGGEELSSGNAGSVILKFHEDVPYVAYQDVPRGYKMTVMKYDVRPATANAANNSFTAAPLTAITGQTIALTAVGDRQSEEGAVKGDERYIPVFWESTEPGQEGTFDWNETEYVSEYVPQAAATYTVTVTFQKQIWNDGDWTNAAGVVDTKSTSVAVSDPISMTAPANVRAVGGDRKIDINWDTVTGATFYNVYMSQTAGDYSNTPLATVTEAAYGITGLNNGTTYYITVKAGNPLELGPVSAEVHATPAAPPTTNPNPETPSPSVTSPVPTSGVDVLVNGKVERAGTATASEVNGQSVTTIAVDEAKLEQRLAAEGVGAVITIPVTADSDVIVGEWNGRMVKSMEEKQAVVEIRTNDAIYRVPAQQIDIDAISRQLGGNVDLKDVAVRFTIAVPTAETARRVQNAATAGSFEIVVPPLDFTVTGAYGDKETEVSKFNVYVERELLLPDTVDPERITTGIVIDPDGTVRHVPTKVIQRESRYYARINSLTNSTYSVVWHPLEFTDVSGHWAEAAVNDMGSRMVVTGIAGSKFLPDQAVTRAEFASIIVRALGLKPETGAAPFLDVDASAWYADPVRTAESYGLIKGFEDGTFRPMERMTREQASIVLTKAMSVTGLQAKLHPASTAGLSFKDAAEVSAWAKDAVSDSFEAGILSGRANGTFDPLANVTKSEVAAMVRRLLQKSELI